MRDVHLQDRLAGVANRVPKLSFAKELARRLAGLLLDELEQFAVGPPPDCGASFFHGVSPLRVPVESFDPGSIDQGEAESR